jgi:hypothetical protein
MALFLASFISLFVRHFTPYSRMVSLLLSSCVDHCSGVLPPLMSRTAL